MNNMKRNDGSGSKVREKRRCRLLPIGIQRKLFVITAMVAAFVTMMAGTIHTDYREINAGNCAELDNVTAVTLSDPGLTFEGWQLYSSDGTLLETVAPGGRFSATALTISFRMKTMSPASLVTRKVLTEASA